MTLAIYTPPACRRYMNLHDGGATFVYVGNVDHGTFDLREPQAAEIETALNLVAGRHPTAFLDTFKIFIPGLALRPWDAKTGWDAFNRYVAVTYDTHMVVGNLPEEATQADINALIAHEIGHAVCYRLVDDDYRDHTDTPLMAEYKKLRGLGPEDPTLPWAKKPWEVFAEDFKNEVVGLAAGEIPRAPEALRPKIRDFFLGLVAPWDARWCPIEIVDQAPAATPPVPKGPRFVVEVKAGSSVITVNGKKIVGKLMVKNERGSLSCGFRDVFRAIGARVSYDTKTGIARAELD